MPSKISKWLSYYKPESVDEMIAWMFSSVKLIEDIEETLEKLSPINLVSDVCQRFFVFYKSGMPTLRQFVIFFLPTLLRTYLVHSYEDSTSLMTRKLSSYPTDTSSFISGVTLLESCLVGICSQYLLLLPQTVPDVFKDYKGFRLPSLGTPSVFHDPVSHKELVDRSGSSDGHIDLNPRIPAVIYLLQNYFDTLSTVDIFNPSTKLLCIHSLTQFCRLCCRITSLSIRPRIPTSPSLLTTLLNGTDLFLYKLDCMDKCSGDQQHTIDLIRSALVDNIFQINKRASHHCFSSCLLLCQSMLHYRTVQYEYHGPTSKRNNNDVSAVSLDDIPIPSLDPSHRTMDRSTLDDPLLSSEHVRSPYSTNEVITNASFRPEVLSEDIPPVDEHGADPDKNGPLGQNQSDLVIRGKGNTAVAIDARIRTNLKKGYTSPSDSNSPHIVWKSTRDSS